MPLIRDFQKLDDICIFDSHLDEQGSVYDQNHLQMLAQVEEHHFWFQRRRDKICQIFRRYVARTSRILEIGGGTGFIAAQLQKLGFSVALSDIHLTGLKIAQQRGLSSLYQFDLYKPPFHAEFDVICLFDVLEHVRDPDRALTQMKSMLKPNGMIILTVPAHAWLWSREDVIAGHQKRFTKKCLNKLLQGSGFTPLYDRYFFSAILPFLLLRRWLKPDHGAALQPEETFAFKPLPLLNKIFDLCTRIEFCLDRFLPNCAGGSLIAIAHKTR